jgi:transcriptional regulator with XRE-family HTH domain
MANRVSALRAAADTGNWLLRDIGRELRVARIVGGKTLAEVARLIGKSASWVSRVERGRIAAIRMTDLTRHAAAVGLKPWIRLFPLGPRILDAPQLALLQRFLERIGHAWGIALEVPVGIAGDMRAADALLTNGSCRCMVEVITRLADFQAQLRSLRRKQRDLGADRLILVLLASTTNRGVLAEIGPAVANEFPVGTREALKRLAEGVDPGGDCLVLL